MVDKILFDRPFSPPLTTAKPRLLDQMRDVLRRKHYSIRTEQSYVDWIRRFILFNAKRHPAQMGKAEVTAFLTYLAARRNVAASIAPNSESRIIAPLEFGYALLRKISLIPAPYPRTFHASRR